MAKKLILVSLRISDDMKAIIDKEVKARRKSRVWDRGINAANFIRETVMFYFEHKHCPKTTTPLAPTEGEPA